MSTSQRTEAVHQTDTSAGATDVDRRRFISGLGVVGAAAIIPGMLQPAWGDAPVATPFTLGVASGDPSDEAVVIHTRLAPDPLNGGGMREEECDVEWRISRDPAMRHWDQAGKVEAHRRNGHAVWVKVDRLLPATTYYYQFRYRGARSRIGRTRTFPSRWMHAHEMRFALVSCQHYEQGYYAAYRDIAAQDFDFVLHVGDYIYEYGANADVPAQRRHFGNEIHSVEDYRNRYALYRLDPHLQQAHASFPFLVTWDDHEVDNNYAALIPEDDQSAQIFFERRRNAYRVYRESMPLAPRVRSRQGSMNLYREFEFGQLAQLHLLDTRQYRTDQPCGDGLQILQTCPAMLDPAATLLGAEQEDWLFRGLRRSRALWNVLAQQVMMMRWDLGVLTGQPVNFFNVDAWDGYQVARDRVTRFLSEQRVRNPIVLTGDIHSSWAADLRAVASDTTTPIVASEFVCTSISSTFGDGNDALVRATLPTNPHIKYFDGLHRGYATCHVTPSEWRTDFRAVQRAAHPVFTVPSADLPVSTLASYRVLADRPGVERI